MRHKIGTLKDVVAATDQSVELVKSRIWMTAAGNAESEFKTLLLSSVFQPVFSLAHRRPIGYEALIRARNAQGNQVSPLDVFSMAGTGQELTQLDRLCRILHVCNFQQTSSDDSWLFLNINPEVVVNGKNYGAFFAEMLEHYSIPPHRIVVEILEGAIQDESHLTEAVEFYKQLGCLVAIDDFGSGHSNFERIWRVTPDIVKLDRSLMLQAVTKPKVRRVLPSLVSLLHEAGCLVLMEGVETQEEALVSMDADVDFVQGYYFAKPMATAKVTPGNTCALTDLCSKFRSVVAKDMESQHKWTSAYTTGFLLCAQALQAGASLERACAGFIVEDAVMRCYLLDAEGVQIGANLTSPFHNMRTDRRYATLEDTTGARWFRRSYFRRAIAQPGQVQMSRPYLSLTGAHMCITMSVALECNGETRVFCCDLNWESMAKCGKTGGGIKN